MGESNIRRAAQGYISRRQLHQLDISNCLEKEGRISLARLGCALALVAALVAVFGPRWFPPAVLALPILGFVWLLVVHDRIRRTRRAAQRAVQYYDHGLSRLAGEWSDFGVQGQSYRPQDHLYALDLDLFGSQSLFQLLCRCRTGAGRQTLADWLTQPAAPEEISRRQEAVDELADLMQLREDLALLGEEVAQDVHPAVLVEWARDSSRSDLAAASWLAPFLVAASMLAILAWVWTLIGPLPLLAVLALQVAFAARYRRLTSEVAEQVQEPQRELTLLSHLLERLENEEFECAKLRDLCGQLKEVGQKPSAHIGRLAKLVTLLDQRRNQFFQPISYLLLWATQLAAAIELWRQESGQQVETWLAAVGEIEALVSLATYRYENPDDPFPEIVETSPLWEGDQLRHPLLPRDRCVANDVRLSSDQQMLVVSGSNMSGKTTLLRTVGINTVLALAGAPVRADRLRLCPVAVGATLRVQDSLQRGESRFFAEVRRVEAVFSLAGGDRPVLFLFDELFSGTNSHDRRIGARAVLESLLERGSIGLLTTHDLALTEIAESLAPRALNFHFQDHVEDGQMVFDYRMRPGVVQRSNALQIMLAAGLKVAPSREDEDRQS